MESKTERRRYYRIDDLVRLSYHQLNDVELSEREGQHAEVPLETLLAEIDRELNQAINLCWQKDPLLARPLGLLNQKLSLIASQQPGLIDNHCPGNEEEVQVNISGCGMAFDSTYALSEEDRLLLCITLSPSNTQLKLQARVVACSVNGPEQNNFRIRVEFEHSATAQEILIQHIVQKHWGKSGLQN